VVMVFVVMPAAAMVVVVFGRRHGRSLQEIN